MPLNVKRARLAGMTHFHDPPILSNLTGQLLIATPQMDDTRFQKSVILMCQHDSSGAMGLIVNKPMEELTLAGLAENLKMETPRFDGGAAVLNGGPVEPRRGHVLHGPDQIMPGSVAVTEDIFMSLHRDMITEIVRGLGPADWRIMLGHAGWAAGQLEEEIRQNMWFHTGAEASLVFAGEAGRIWPDSYARAGIDASRLSPVSGQA